MTAPLVAPAPSPAVDDPDVDHLYCCDENRAWCGADISNMTASPEGSGNTECALCVYANETYRGCACQQGAS